MPTSARKTAISLQRVDVGIAPYGGCIYLLHSLNKNT